MVSSLLPIFLSLVPLGGERVYHDAPVTFADSSATIQLVSGGLESVRAEARVAMKSIPERQGMASAWWELRLSSPDDTLAVKLHHGNTDFGDILDRRITRLTISRKGDALVEKEVEGFAPGSGFYNTLSAELDACGHLLVSGGSKAGKILAETDIAPFQPVTADVAVCGGEGTMSLFCCESLRSPGAVMATMWTMESLAERIKNSDDQAEGFWKYLDRENDPEYARPGGRYLLATVKNERGEYDIIYVDGAQTYADKWEPMMLKGRLTPTIFIGHYDLEWVDSSFESISEDIHADITDGAILTVSFPLLKSKMRFSKMPLR